MSRSDQQQIETESPGAGNELPGETPSLDGAPVDDPSVLPDRVPVPEVTFEGLLAMTPPESHALIQKAYDFARKHHEGQTRLSGEPYIHHPVAVAGYLAELHLDAASVAAGLLHDVLEDTTVRREQLDKEFPAPIGELVQGVTKIGKMNFRTTHDAQVENLRLMILAMAKDIRVVIIKLCDRLHNMKTLKYLPEEKRIAISQETMDIYAPLANRLGISRIKGEMEDLAMRWIYPEQYQKLTRHIATKKKERERIVQESIRHLSDYLKGSYPHLIINGRPKHFYSIFKKMREQNLPFEQIYDLTALRVLCETKTQCYAILGLIHAIWPPLPGRFKDYVATPKKNQYQSLHTTVMGLEGTIIEIQIRTKEMHTIAELGIAAHWNYKEKGVEVQKDERLTWLRQLSEWVTDVKESEGLLDALKQDVFADSVLCFTPNGDVIHLPAGATPIDFAYAIHTGVGERCTGAKVNNLMVTLRTQLHNGDVVEIITAPSGHPSPDWLQIAVTQRAKQKIKHWLKTLNLDEWIETGRRKLNRFLEEKNHRVPQAELDEGLDRILAEYKLPTRNDLLVEIGFGSISAQAAITRMNPAWAQVLMPERKRVSTRRRGTGPIIIQGMQGVPTKISSCCSPIPGDPIIGFITRGRGVTVHHANCKNVIRLRTDEEDAARLVPAQWNMDGTPHTVWIGVLSEDRTGLLNDITGIITKNNLFINRCTTNSDAAKHTAMLSFEVNVQSAAQLDAVLEEILRQRGMISAGRRKKPA
ncbi:bifunctional (p)ppGpp synthetase/guanosine-3',5'-bis(diphosphate) 3'-pyrophosphohydrolase [Candidatus Sumerlaeota bacterium]|nr:bifunctional (p)ppGpp synthetase/guanosine-3',5'-bis(diphosphate) 3'-pyrophosphohydrolase [Candidatus Sumerlaeota bacterium]